MPRQLAYRTVFFRLQAAIISAKWYQETSNSLYGIFVRLKIFVVLIFTFSRFSSNCILL
jgi:hypothetical protein